MSVQSHTLDSLRIDRSKARRRPFVALLLVVLLLLGCAAAALGWWVWRSMPTTVRTVPVCADGAAPSDRTLLNASGYVSARRGATVSSKVTGKVTEVLVEEGMQVESGQVLARIDSSNVEAGLRLRESQLEATRAELGETEASLLQARRELDRLRRTAALGAATPVELERAETQVGVLDARLQRQLADVVVDEQQVLLWRQDLEDTVITAPFAGVVTAKNAQPGEMISPMSVGGFTRTGICTIVDMASLEIEVDVSESLINRVTPGQPVEATLDSYPDWRIPARVVAIIPTADRQKATVKVRVAFENVDPRILPDMSVKVAFREVAEDDVPPPALRIPAEALSSREGRDVVWVIRDGRAERRAVTLGAREADQIGILAGLAAGERVALDAPPGLADGARVRETKQ
jgi:RND family efflux transporter MFP subunit